jgi:hypothetical protein
MDINNIISAISTIGFPTVACVVLFNLYNKTITSFKDSIDNNTQAIQLLKDTIENNVFKRK